MLAEIVELRDNKLTLERPGQEKLTPGDGPGNIFGSANESIISGFFGRFSGFEG